MIPSPPSRVVIQDVIGPVRLYNIKMNNDNINLQTLRSYFAFKEKKSDRCQGIADQPYIDTYEKYVQKNNIEMFYTKDNSGKMSSLLIFCDKHKTYGSNQNNNSFSEKKQFISLTKNEPFKIVNDDDKKTMQELSLEELDKDIVCDLSLICNDSDVKGLGSILFDNLVKEMKNRYENRWWEERKKRNVAKIIAGQALPVLNDKLKEKTKNNDNPFYKPWKRLLDQQDKEKELYFYYPTNQKEENIKEKDEENEKEKDEDIVERVMIFEIPLFEEKS